jgi:hypothetical protein
MLNRDLYGNDEVAPSQTRFEWDRVMMAMDRFRLQDHGGALLDDEEYRHGTPRLTFESFRRKFPTFPVVLEARWVARIANKCRPADLFRRFGDTALIDLYLETYARRFGEAEGRPIGLVVPFDRYRGGMVIHNGVFDTRGTRLVHDIPGDRPPHRITIEPYDRLLTYLSRGGWSPDKSLADQPVAGPDSAAHRMTVLPCMVRRLGSGPAVIVLAWLSTVLTSPVGLHRKFVRRCSNGDLCVLANQAEIATETGLSDAATKRGLAKLRGERLIRSPRRQRRLCIVLAPDWAECRRGRFSKSAF